MSQSGVAAGAASAGSAQSLGQHLKADGCQLRAVLRSVIARLQSATSKNVELSLRRKQARLGWTVSTHCSTAAATSDRGVRVAERRSCWRSGKQRAGWCRSDEPANAARLRYACVRVCYARPESAALHVLVCCVVRLAAMCDVSTVNRLAHGCARRSLPLSSGPPSSKHVQTYTTAQLHQPLSLERRRLQQQRCRLPTSSL